MAEIPNQLRNKWDHSSKKHCSRQIVGMEQNQTGTDVGPIGITNDNQLLPAKTVSFRGSIDELCQLLCAKLEILDIKNSLGKAPEEARHPVLEDLATDSEKCCPRPQFMAQRQKVILVTTGPMQ